MYEMYSSNGIFMLIVKKKKKKHIELPLKTTKGLDYMLSINFCEPLNQLQAFYKILKFIDSKHSFYTQRISSLSINLFFMK